MQTYLANLVIGFSQGESNETSARLEITVSGREAGTRYLLFHKWGEESPSKTAYGRTSLSE